MITFRKKIAPESYSFVLTLANLFLKRKNNVPKKRSVFVKKDNLIQFIVFGN